MFFRSIVMVSMVVFLTSAGAREIFADGTPTSQPAAAAPEPAAAAPAVKPSEEHYQEGKKASDAGNFAEALKYFQMADTEDPDNPDILNMLAHSYRKQGQLKEAFENYDKALSLRPDFAEAHEYLAEAHIQAALKEAETLKSYGPAQAHELDEVIENLEKALETAKGYK